MSDVRQLCPKLSSDVSEKFQRQLIKLVIASIQQVNIDKVAIERIKLENNVSEEDFCQLISAYTIIVTTFIHSSKEEFEEKLITAGYNQSFIDNLPFNNQNKEALLTNLENNDAAHTNLRYKIDISLNNNVLKRVVPPWVIMTVNSNNKDITFSVDITTFHKLRFNVALLLKELNTLKNTHILKK